LKPERRQALISQIQQRPKIICSHLSEIGKRLWAASEAITIGRGGDTIVSNATGISRVTISKAKKEIEEVKAAIESIRIWESGDGRKRLVDSYPGIIKELDVMIDPFTRGDPESPLRWTCKSTYNLADALQVNGYKISQKTVYTLLQEMGYSMQANRKKMEGKQNPDRDAQFQFINKKEGGYPFRWPNLGIDRIISVLSVSYYSQPTLSELIEK